MPSEARCLGRGEEQDNRESFSLRMGVPFLSGGTQMPSVVLGPQGKASGFHLAPDYTGTKAQG